MLSLVTCLPLTLLTFRVKPIALDELSNVLLYAHSLSLLVALISSSFSLMFIS